jgi:hypothetical protein
MAPFQKSALMVRRAWPLFPVVLAFFALTDTAHTQRGPQPSLLAINVSPRQVNFALVRSGISNGSSPLTITTVWHFPRGGGSEVSVWAYFANPGSALSSGTSVIPSSRVLGRVQGQPFVPFTASGPFSPGGSLLVFTVAVRDNKRNTRTDSLDLQIDTTGLNLRPGTYSGSLRIQISAL